MLHHSVPAFWPSQTLVALLAGSESFFLLFPCFSSFLYCKELDCKSVFQQLSFSSAEVWWVPCLNCLAYYLILFFFPVVSELSQIYLLLLFCSAGTKLRNTDGGRWNWDNKWRIASSSAGRASRRYSTSSQHKLLALNWGKMFWPRESYLSVCLGSLCLPIFCER